MGGDSVTGQVFRFVASGRNASNQFMKIQEGKMGKKSLTGILVVFFIILGPWIIQAPVLAGAPQAIKIGAVLPQTGGMAAGGQEVESGYELFVDHINKKGGVYVKEFGKKLPIELIMLDDESDPVKSAARLEKLYSVDNVVAYLGGFSSLLNVAGMSIAEKDKVPWVGVTIAVEAPLKKGFRYVFVPFGMSGSQTKAFFDVLDSIPKAERPRKVVNFELQTDWGIECGNYIQKLAKERGYDLMVEKYAPVTRDYSSMILAAKSAGADALFSVPTPPQAIGLVKQMKELDYAPKITCFVRGADFWTYWEALKQDANYITSDGNWDEYMPYPGNKELRRDYLAKHKGVKSIGVAVGSAYAAGQVLAAAIEKAGTLDREKIRDALARTDMMTVKGPVKFRENDTAEVVYGLRQWQNGEQKIITPPEIANAKVLLAPPWSQR
jgi:branched-chain amino acid transport system substrate-binding protein